MRNVHIRLDYLAVLAIAVFLLGVFVLGAMGDTTGNKPKPKAEQLGVMPKKQGITSLEGIYELVGKDVKNNYVGSAIIRKTDDYRYAMVSQSIGPGGSFQNEAIGIISGDTIAFGWTIKGVPGVTVYTIDRENGILTGKWTSTQSPVQTERLRRIAPLPKED